MQLKCLTSDIWIDMWDLANDILVALANEIKLFCLKNKETWYSSRVTWQGWEEDFILHIMETNE